jgi:hypothetical protein
MRHTPAPRLPRAGIDPIDSHDLALLTVSMAIHRPLRHETVVAVLDDARRGIAIAVVTGTCRADDVIEVVECLTSPAAHDGAAAGIVVASVRPGGGLDPGDADRWLEQSAVAEQHGVELLEWFVIGTDVHCPRDLLGEKPRW